MYSLINSLSEVTTCQTSNHGDSDPRRAGGHTNGQAVHFITRRPETAPSWSS